MTWDARRSHFEPAPAAAPGEYRGTDVSGRLAVVMDGAGQVARVEIDRLDALDALREAAPLARALAEAWNTAEAPRVRALAEAGPERERLTALGNALLEGRYRVTLPEPPPVPEPDFSRHEASAAGLALLDGRWAPEGEYAAPHDVVGDAASVLVELSRGGVPRTVIAGPDWLSRVSPAGLSAALTRALAGSRPTQEVA